MRSTLCLLTSLVVGGSTTAVALADEAEAFDVELAHGETALLQEAGELQVDLGFDWRESSTHGHVATIPALIELGVVDWMTAEVEAALAADSGELSGVGGGVAVSLLRSEPVHLALGFEVEGELEDDEMEVGIAPSVALLLIALESLAFNLATGVEIVPGDDGEATEVDVGGSLTALWASGPVTFLVETGLTVPAAVLDDAAIHVVPAAKYDLSSGFSMTLRSSAGALAAAGEIGVGLTLSWEAELLAEDDDDE